MKALRAAWERAKAWSSGQSAATQFQPTFREELNAQCGRVMLFNFDLVQSSASYSTPGRPPCLGVVLPPTSPTARYIGDRVGYCHVKDAMHEPGHPRAMEDGWRYVSPGAGQLPLAASIRILREHDYDGWLLFEHEKRWHPELPEPEQIFPGFVLWARSLI